MQSQDVLVVRPNFDPYPVLSRRGRSFFTGLKRQLNFADATSAAQDKHANFDLVTVLTLFLAGNVLTDIHPTRSESTTAPCLDL